jgi:DUF971 family protein
LADRSEAAQGQGGVDGRVRYRRDVRVPAEFLRVYSPSAEVQGHSPDERKTVGGKRHVTIIEVHPIGNYAVRLVFDDLHSTGIFSWDYFLKLGRDQGRLWGDYLGELAAKGLARDPPKRG